MEKIIVHHRSSHHALNSGYSLLANYLGAITEIPTGNHKLPYTVKKYISKNINQTAGIYGVNSVQKDWDLTKHIIFSKNKDRVIHYLNSERDIRLITKIASIYSKTKICASFHYPPNLLPKVTTNTHYLKKLNGAVAVGSNQVDFIKNWLDLEHVKFIPHGVNCDFFRPNTAIKQQNTILFVGQHLRDFEAFNYAIPRLIEKVPNIEINVVLRSDYASEVTAKGVNIFSNIDDNSLKKMYQKATLLFLPLQDSTACNAILEALACGLPVVSTDIGGNCAYVKNDSGILLPKEDYKALVDSTISLLNNPEKIIQMGLNARATAEEFEWEKVAITINDFYISLLNKQ